MNQPRVSIIAAVAAKDRGIGKRGGMPWYIPAELKRFKEITMGHPIIMGRKTHESIGKSLPGRTNIVVTRDPNYQATQGSIVVSSLEEALKVAKEKDREEIFVIGGGQIYEQAMALADRLYLTLVEGNFDSDVFFPDYSVFTKVVSKSSHESDGFRYKFLVLGKE